MSSSEVHAAGESSVEALTASQGLADSVSQDEEDDERGAQPVPYLREEAIRDARSASPPRDRADWAPERGLPPTPLHLERRMPSVLFPADTEEGGSRFTNRQMEGSFLARDETGVPPRELEREPSQKPQGAADQARPVSSPHANRTRRVPRPVLIGRAASLTPYRRAPFRRPPWGARPRSR